MCFVSGVFFFQAEDGIRYLVRSRGLGDVYKRQGTGRARSQRTSAMVARLEAILMSDDRSSEYASRLLSLIHI